MVFVKADAVETLDDPALGPFLDLIERDLVERPRAIRPVTSSYADELRQLVADADIDLDAALED